MAEKTYTRSNGKTVLLADMAVPHLQAAIAKLKREGYISRADLSLFASEPDGAAVCCGEDGTSVLVVSDILGDLEIELKGRMG